MYEMLSYKGFVSAPKYSIEDKVIYGYLENVDGFISYEAEDSKSVESAFIEAVEDYLDTCKELGVPGMPKNTQFNIAGAFKVLGQVRPGALAINAKNLKYGAIDGGGN